MAKKLTEEAKAAKEKIPEKTELKATPIEVVNTAFKKTFDEILAKLKSAPHKANIIEQEMEDLNKLHAEIKKNLKEI